MSWGTKITIVFSLFVAGILVMVFKASRQQVDLVVPDYYEQELKYQDRIDEINRAAQLSEAVKFDMNNSSIEILFPREMYGTNTKAIVWLYCVANKTKDIKKSIETKNGKITLPFSQYNKGLHEIKLQWVANGISYYKEQKIFIQ